MIIMIGITVGQIHRQNGQQNRSRYCPLTFRTVQNTHLWEAQKERMTVKHHTAMRLYPTSLHVVFHRDCHTACGGYWQILSLGHGQTWRWALPQPDVTESKMFCVSGNNNTNEIVLTRPADRLLGTNGPVLHSILHQHDQTKQIFIHHLVSTIELTRWRKITIDYGKYRM